MKCIALLLVVASCASAYVHLNYYPSTFYGGASYLWRKKRAAPVAPVEDQQADPAMYYSSLYGYPYAGYPYGIHYRKKRETPAEDQQADPALYYSSLYGYPYTSYTAFHHLKKREAPAEDQQAQDATILYSHGYYNPFGYHGYYYKK